MKELTGFVRGLSASLIVGILYGAIAGAAFGTCLAPIIGTLFGFVFGAFGGAIFGIIGGISGGPVGWGFGGFVGGLMSSSLLNPGRPQEAVDFIPAFILCAIGICIGIAQYHPQPRIPLMRWLQENRNVSHSLHGWHSIRIALILLAVFSGSLLLQQRFTASPLQISALDD